MLAAALERRLTANGLAVLAVVDHVSEPDLRVVYLHGNAGQWAGGRAHRRISRLKEVVRVVTSPQSPTILLVRVTLAADRP